MTILSAEMDSQENIFGFVEFLDLLYGIYLPRKHFNNNLLFHFKTK